jgi:hypothetical protein
VPLVVPEVVAGKVIEVALNDTVGMGAVAVPLSATVCDPPAALSLTVSWAEELPAAFDVKVTATAQAAPGASVAPHVLVSVKLPGLVPVIAMPLMLTALVPVSVSVTVWALLTLPAVSEGKVIEDALNDTVGIVAVAVPLNATDCVFPTALSLTTSRAVELPAVLDRKVTVMVQVAPGARVAPQVLVSVKLLELVPVIAMLLMPTTFVPAFVSVVVCGALATVVGVVKVSAGPREANVASTLLPQPEIAMIAAERNNVAMRVGLQWRAVAAAREE